MHNETSLKKKICRAVEYVYGGARENESCARFIGSSQFSTMGISGSDVSLGGRLVFSTDMVETVVTEMFVDCTLLVSIVFALFWLGFSLAMTIF